MCTVSSLRKEWRTIVCAHGVYRDKGLYTLILPHSEQDTTQLSNTLNTPARQHHNTMHCNYNYTQNLAVKPTEQNRTEQNRTEQNRTEQNRTEQNRTEQNRTEQNRTEQNRTEQNRTEQNRTEQNRTEQNRTEQNTNQHHTITSLRTKKTKQNIS